MTRDAREIEREGMLSDMDTLRAEKRELRAEVELLRKAADADGFHRVLAARDDKIERLKAENARLKEIEIKYDQLISGAFV